jgi:hypothetical protein
VEVNLQVEAGMEVDVEMALDPRAGSRRSGRVECRERVLPIRLESTRPPFWFRGREKRARLSASHRLDFSEADRSPLFLPLGGPVPRGTPPQ